MEEIRDNALSMRREQRFRMELHAMPRRGLMPDRHHLPRFAEGARAERTRASERRHKGMIAPDKHRRLNAGEHAAAVMADRACFAVKRFQ